jgi:hypothetical protein
MSPTSKSGPLDYEFTPIPRAAIHAVRDGQLDGWAYLILAALYDRDVPHNKRVRFTLDQLADWIAWPHTHDALSKRLRRLRHDMWLSYEQPRMKPYRYHVTLITEPQLSEHGPRSRPASHAACSAPEEVVHPSTRVSGPSSASAETEAPKPSQARDGSDAVRPPQRVQRNPSSLEETVGPTVPMDPARAREVSGPTGDQIPDAILARREKLPESEQATLDDFVGLLGAREIAGPLPPRRVLDRVEGVGIIVELVAVRDAEFDGPTPGREKS